MDYLALPARLAAKPDPHGPVFVSAKGTAYVYGSFFALCKRVRTAVGLTPRGRSGPVSTTSPYRGYRPHERRLRQRGRSRTKALALVNLAGTLRTVPHLLVPQCHRRTHEPGRWNARNPQSPMNNIGALPRVVMSVRYRVARLPLPTSPTATEVGPQPLDTP